MRTAKTLIRLGGCPDLSESSLGAHAKLFWFCHALAQIYFLSLFKCAIPFETVPSDNTRTMKAQLNLRICAV